MSHALRIICLLVYTLHVGEGEHLLYLTFRENVSATATQKFFNATYGNGTNTIFPDIVFKSLGIYETPNETLGIFGAKGYFTNLMNISHTPIPACPGLKNDLYVSSLDLEPVKLLNACIDLLEKMRDETNGFVTEKSVIAIAKYMTDIQNPFELLPFITSSQMLETKMMIFWYQDVNDAEILIEKINENNANNVILLLSMAHLNNVLEKAFEKNLFTWNRRWVVMPFDGILPSLPSGREVNNKNISVVFVGNHTKENIDDSLDSLEEKLAYDTAHVAKAYIDKGCNYSNDSELFEGYTGNFNMANMTHPRQSVALTIARGLLNKPNIIGSITIDDNDAITVEGAFNELFTFTNGEMNAILQSRPIRLAVMLSPPFVLLNETATRLSGKVVTSCNIAHLSGLSVDIVRAILDPINVTYQCTLYQLNDRDKALKSVYDGTADMAVGEFAVLPQLKDDFEFISNFLYFTFSILEKPRSNTEKTFLWLFFKPLSAGTWVVIVVCGFVVALVLATLNYFSPNQVDYGFIESIFVCFGCLLQGLTVSPPNTWSSRFMQCVWWLFVLFFIVIYIANYAAFIMGTGIQNEATGFTALLADPSIPFGPMPNSLAAVQLDNSEDLDIRKVNYLRYKLYPQDQGSNATIEERVKMVSEGKYRLIGDSFTLEYFASNDCLIVSGEFSSQQYAIILKKGTVYTTYLNNILTNLINKGEIKTIIDKYTTSTGASSCTASISQNTNNEGRRRSITLSEVAGIFILMLIGLVVAVVFSVVECLFARKLVPLADRILRSETRARLRNFF